MADETSDTTVASYGPTTDVPVEEETAEPVVVHPPVVVNNFTRRSDNDALLGTWADVVAGEHQGRRGHYFEDVSHGTDGYPQTVLVRTRDADNLVIEVDYADLRPSAYTGGR